jgi:hypothetical protein
MLLTTCIEGTRGLPNSVEAALLLLRRPTKAGEVVALAVPPIHQPAAAKLMTRRSHSPLCDNSAHLFTRQTSICLDAGISTLVEMDRSAL